MNSPWTSARTKFIDETGSELVNRSTRMFVHGTTMGGSPERVGRISSDFALNISLLRSQRRVRALPFAYLTIPLHGAMTGLLIFVLQIMLSFNERIFSATAELEAQSPGAIGKIPNLPAFQPKDMDQIIWLTLLAVIILTITNSLSPHFATGGHSLKLAFYGSIMCIISGVNLMIIPSIAGSLLSI